ncbi:MAG: hypothetical protein PVF90_02320 [Gemmatimonadota bacterium]
MMRTRTRWTLGAMPFSLLLAACGSMGANTSVDDPFQGDAGRNEIRIHIRNNNFYDARIIALLEGTTRRQLGTVGGKTEAVFTLPLVYSRGLRLEIDLLAGPTCVTDEITADPGDDIQLDILPAPPSQDFCR